MTLLLTGAAGFIGTVVRDRLITNGERVRVFDIAQDRRDDVCDLDRVRGAMQGCDVLAPWLTRATEVAAAAMLAQASTALAGIRARRLV